MWSLDFLQYLKGRKRKCFYRTGVGSEVAYQENTIAVFFCLEFLPNVKWGKEAILQKTSMWGNSAVSKPTGICYLERYCVIL